MYPSVPRLERVAKKTVRINGITIPKNMTVVVPVYALHHDPQHWPQPEEFRPDRCSVWTPLETFNMLGNL